MMMTCCCWCWVGDCSRDCETGRTRLFLALLLDKGLPLLLLLLVLVEEEIGGY